MKIKAILKLVVSILLLVSCGKTQPAANAPPRVEAKPFHNEIYQSLDHEIALTLISPDECELRTGKSTLLCSYTKQTDMLRVVATSFGGKQVLYYKMIAEGIQDNDGKILLSPQHHAAAIEQIRLRQQVEQKKQQEEKIRLSALTEESKKETKNIFKATIRYPFGSDRMQAGYLKVTDVGVKVHLNNFKSGEVEDSDYWFGDLADSRLSDRGQIYINGFNIRSASIWFYDDSDAAKAVNAINDSRAAWKQKFPEVVPNR